jgi:protein-disulfide isomerase
VPARNRKAAASSGSNLKQFYWILAVIGVLGIAGIAWFTMGGGGKAAETPVELKPEDLANAQDLVKKAQSIKLGPDNAPLRILVFSDFQCPACAHYGTKVEPNLKKEYVETGKVQLVYHDYPLSGHRWAFLAARAGRCALEQNKFWEYHDGLLTRQRDWSFDPTAPVKDFEEIAASVGIEAKGFKTCLNSDKYADVVSFNQAVGNQLRVGGTPALFLNGRLLGQEWGDYTMLKARIEQELARLLPATTAPAATSTTQ